MYTVIYDLIIFEMKRNYKYLGEKKKKKSFQKYFNRKSTTKYCKKYPHIHKHFFLSLSVSQFDSSTSKFIFMFVANIIERERGKPTQKGTTTKFIADRNLS